MAKVVIPEEGELHRVLPRFTVSLVALIGLLSRWRGMKRASGGLAENHRKAAEDILAGLIGLQNHRIRVNPILITQKVS